MPGTTFEKRQLVGPRDVPLAADAVSSTYVRLDGIPTWIVTSVAGAFPWFWNAIEYVAKSPGPGWDGSTVRSRVITGASTVTSTFSPGPHTPRSLTPCIQISWTPGTRSSRPVHATTSAGPP